MYNLLLTLLMIDSVLIIIAVLMQPAKQDDAMSALSGGGTDLFSHQNRKILYLFANNMSTAHNRTFYLHSIVYG